jgi:hypothetical protein
MIRPLLILSFVGAQVCLSDCQFSNGAHNPWMAKNRTLNRAHQKAWYDRTRSNPARWRAFLERRNNYKRMKRRAEQATTVRKVRPAAIDHRDGAEEPLADEITWAFFYGVLIAGLDA